MSNSRRINERADRAINKRRRANTQGTYHDRVVEEEDFEVVHSRASGLNSRHIHVETPRSPQKGRTTWIVGDSWAPRDDPEVGLDPAGWCDEEFAKEVTEPARPKSKKKKRSRVSVRPSSSFFIDFRTSSFARNAPM